MLCDKKWINGTIYRFAGTGNPGYSGDGEKAEEAQLNVPAGLAVGSSNIAYIAEIHNNVIRKMYISMIIKM